MKKGKAIFGDMSGYKQKVCFLGLALMLFSCSPQRDGIISRTYNAVTAKYNILYNGHLAFEEGLEELNASYQDNFWELIEIEPLAFDTSISEISEIINANNPQAKSENKNATYFEKAEEKAVKAIQLHSINIDGTERNSQMDDAYLLLGKSRYYTQRFAPAIDAFNYILTTDPKANLRDETKIWRAKANIRLNNESFAIETLSLLLRDPSVSTEIKEQAHTALAIAYQKKGNIQETIRQLNLATRTLKNVQQGQRNLFVLGQLYALQNQKDLAKKVFLKLVNFKKASYGFKIHAQIEIAKNESSDRAIAPLLQKFKKLLSDGTNQQFEGELYYQIALLEESRDSTELAIDYLKKSLQSESMTAYHKTYSYEKLGDIEFKKANFLIAGKYYDSILQINKNIQDPRIRTINRKHKGLANLLQLEGVLQNNDSILNIVSMPKTAQRSFFEKHIAALKAADEQRVQQALNSSSFGNSSGGVSAAQPNSNGKWYFYNTQLVAFGKAAFEKQWGNRPLEDNWRISDKAQLNTDKSTNVKEEINKASYNLSTYMSRIPTNRTVIDSLRFYRNEALYETGIIYKEQFKNLGLAALRLERLISLKPDKDLILPSYYQLYQVYKELNHPKAETYKNEIIKNYPSSRYAEILTDNKAFISDNKDNDIEALYKDLYQLFKENYFQEVVSQIDQLSPMLQESKLIAKFELLKAFAIGKYQTKEAYKKALEFVSKNYANLEEGIRAKELLKQLK